MCTRLLALALAAVAEGWTMAAPAAIPVANAGCSFALSKGQGTLEVSYQGRRILIYAFATNQFKPYVRELCTLAGDNVLLDAPPDHQHHHGFMYAIRVNGNNFWEERDQPGFEKPVELQGLQTGTTSSGLPQARFTHLIHWVANKDASAIETSAVALLVERRTLSLTIDEPRKEVALDWDSEFEVGATPVTLSGANYHGLGLRLPEVFNRVAQHQNSENAPYPTGTGDVTAARWSSVWHELNGRDTTVALFTRPSSGPSLFFTMVQPFTYLSATQGLDKRPLRYSPGERFSLAYRLVVYSERKSPEFLNERYGGWIQQ